MNVEEIRRKLTETKRMREQFMTQANAQLGHYEGRIATLEELLAELEGEQNEEPEEDANELSIQGS